MTEVHQHPDGLMYIRTPGLVYVDAIANFILDFGEAPPALPAGANERIYTFGVRHALMGDGNVIDGGPMPWDIGDRWISNIRKGLNNQAKRMEALNAQQVSQASQDYGGGSTQSGIRKAGGYTTVRGEGIQSGGQGNWNSSEEEKERLDRRL